MAESKERKTSTAKSPEVTVRVVIETLGPPIGTDAQSPTVPPSPTGNFCWCCRDGVVGWYPEEG